MNEKVFLNEIGEEELAGNSEKKGAAWNMNIIYFG